MIRCPNCGSTAQVRVVSAEDTSFPASFFVKECECGCGCKFNVVYKVIDTLVKED